MSTHLVLVDIQKAFLQIGLREEDRDAFPFLFNINGQEQHQRFTHKKTKRWNTEVSEQLKREWIKCSNQIKTVRVPRSVARGVGRVQAIHLYVFADASNITCSAVTIAVAEGETGVVKSLLISKRNTSIGRLELVGGQIAANMVRNLQNALKRWPIVTTTVWIDSMVALYWVINPGKSLKVFVTNRVSRLQRSPKRRELSGDIARLTGTWQISEVVAPQ